MRRERGGQPVEVELLGRGQGHVHGLRAAQDRVRSVILVKRLEHDHFVARVHDREQGRRHRLGSTAGDRNLGFRVHVHPVPVRVLAGERVPEPLGPPGDGVLVHVVANQYAITWGAKRLRDALARKYADWSRLAPQVMAYWFTSSRIARAAASFRTSGAGKFGNPWARLMAPCSLASLVIPRITDSVNEWVRRAVCIEAEVTRQRPRRNSPGPSISLLSYRPHATEDSRTK